MIFRQVASRQRDAHARANSGILSRRLREAGFADGDAMTINAAEGIHPRGRELSFAWLTGTVMTGLTSVLLMGAALYVSVGGQANFSTPYDAMRIGQSAIIATGATTGEKVNRARPVTRTQSDKAIIEASIRSSVDGRSMITSQEFVRVEATLATSATPLAEDVPKFDPAAYVTTEPVVTTAQEPATEIYAANVEGEVAVATSPFPATLIPAGGVSDQQAAEFVQASLLEVFSGEADDASLGYTVAPVGETTPNSTPAGVAENVTVLAKTLLPADGGSRAERIINMREAGSLKEQLLKNGFTERSYQMVVKTLTNVFPGDTLPAGAKLRILMGASRTSAVPVPYRLSIYVHDPKTQAVSHAATAALTDEGTYVIGLAPPMIDFPNEDTESVDVTKLPSIYRAIWETARKQEIDDETTRKVIAMFAYDIDLNEKITLGDSIRLLMSQRDGGSGDLLYASLTLAGTTRELFRYQASDGSVDFYSADGATAKRFLTRRPLEGGGRLSSRWGYRIHPIFKTRKLHTGVDLAAPRGTPVYAGGDGVVRRAQWVSGYGRYVEIDHVNGYQTAYAHMDRIADGLKPGMRVKQGQIVGYVGATGNVTGNHLHYEVRINGRTVDPLSVKLPRDRELPGQSQELFDQTTAQIRQLMARDAQGVRT